ncbi:Uu.00g019630.m01.CDS01 [Anthostomella pinea]|uniref:Carboxylic ester hydrolase n=1 Tax=Anthostomella pinea TaxID=933095 RepID=A0AAI8VZZ0_9PEZI|nr:Uu.00g019630.m01.CDS01 [Anthostomella pinea]
MWATTLLLAGVASAAAGHPTNSTLAIVCTDAYARAALPADNVCPGIIIDHSSISTGAFYGVSFTGQYNYPDATFNYCNVTFAYSHNGRNDRVLVTYWLPAPADFQARFLSTGGGGWAINEGNNSVAGGIAYGAAAGLTDGGFGSFDNAFDDVFPLANGTINWPPLYMWGYQGIHEMTVIGKAFTKKFFNMGNESKLYSYYQGCSEGGREGWSQVQRFNEFDGVITGAPAFRFAQQQIIHLHSNVVEQTLDYYPPPCELDEIVNQTIAACDPLDGKTDGVVSRSDLCKLHFNLNSTIGKPYSCPATAGNPSGGVPPSPEQKGAVSAQGVAVAATIIEGLKDSQGNLVYFSYQPAAAFVDAQTQYNATSGKYELLQQPFGAEWVERYLHLQNASLLPTFEGVTYNTLEACIKQGMQMYEQSLQTTWPDLTPYHQAGGKILHYHGESDPSIPTASSVRYHESVRQIMYPRLSYNESNARLNEWYKLYLVPGAGHCAPNTYQPNGPFPQTNLQVMIDWVEEGVEPKTLNATVLLGEHKGENRQICEWPLRPYWPTNGTEVACVYDQPSIDTWHYDLDVYKVPIY